MSTVSIPEPQTVSIDRAAVALGISRGTAYAAAHKGELPVIRIGRRLLVPRDALERLLAGEPAPQPRQPAEAVLR